FPGPKIRTRGTHIRGNGSSATAAGPSCFPRSETPDLGHPCSWRLKQCNNCLDVFANFSAVAQVKSGSFGVVLSQVFRRGGRDLGHPYSWRLKVREDNGRPSIAAAR